jgi:MFS family permease
MSPDSALQRRTLSVLVIMQVIGTVGVGVAPSIGVLLAEQVTDNEAWAGLARTASTLGAALLGLPLGRLAANRGRRVALSTGWFSAAAGAALLIFAAQESEVVTLFIGLLLIGAGSAVSLQSRFAATDLSDPRHRGRHLALVVWVGTLGSVIGPNLGVPGEVLHAATGLSVFAGAFLVAAVCLALAGVVAFLFLRPDPLLTARSAVAITMPDAPGAASVVTPPTPSGTVGASRRPTGVRRKGALRHMLSEVQVNADARLALTAVLTAQVVMVAVMTMTPVHMEHQGHLRWADHLAARRRDVRTLPRVRLGGRPLGSPHRDVDRDLHLRGVALGRGVLLPQHRLDHRVSDPVGAGLEFHERRRLRTLHVGGVGKDPSGVTGRTGFPGESVRRGGRVLGRPVAGRDQLLDPRLGRGRGVGATGPRAGAARQVAWQRPRLMPDAARRTSRLEHDDSSA